MDKIKLDWEMHRFDELTGPQMHAVLALRQAVFVVEQACIYPDADDLDVVARHLTGRDGSGVLAAYARILPPGSRYEEPSVGRVLVAAPFRGLGIGRRLMKEALGQIEIRWVHRDVRVSAQTYLAEFYQSLGFVAVGRPYDDAGVMHLDMIRKKVQTAHDTKRSKNPITKPRRLHARN